MDTTLTYKELFVLMSELMSEEDLAQPVRLCDPEREIKPLFIYRLNQDLGHSDDDNGEYGLYEKSDKAEDDDSEFIAIYPKGTIFLTTELPTKRVTELFSESEKLKTGIELIAEERKRQIEVEGWTPEHDAEHTGHELAILASYYALPDESRFLNKVGMPFPRYWKPTPKNRIKELQKAGALIAAEIDRLQRV